MPEQYQRLPLWNAGLNTPALRLLKYRPKNPRLYFSEIKPLGLIHIQSLVTSRAAGLSNLVLAAVIGKSCFVLVSCEMRAWIRSVGLTYIWLPALSAQSKPETPLNMFYRQIRLQGVLLHSLNQFKIERSVMWSVSCEHILLSKQVLMRDATQGLQSLWV